MELSKRRHCEGLIQPVDGAGVVAGCREQARRNDRFHGEIDVHGLDGALGGGRVCDLEGLQ